LADKCRIKGGVNLRKWLLARFLAYFLQGSQGGKKFLKDLPTKKKVAKLFSNASSRSQVDRESRSPLRPRAMKPKEALSQAVSLSFPTKEVSQEKFRGTKKSPKSNKQ
jgi:hypothetical protein